MEFLESSMAQQRSLFQHMIDVFANTVLNSTNQQIRVLDQNMKHHSEILAGNRQVLSEQLGLTNVYLEIIARAAVTDKSAHVFDKTIEKYAIRDNRDCKIFLRNSLTNFSEGSRKSNDNVCWHWLPSNYLQSKTCRLLIQRPTQRKLLPLVKSLQHKQAQRVLK